MTSSTSVTISLSFVLLRVEIFFLRFYVTSFFETFSKGLTVQTTMFLALVTSCFSPPD